MDLRTTLVNNLLKYGVAVQYVNGGEVVTLSRSQGSTYTLDSRLFASPLTLSSNAALPVIRDLIKDSTEIKFPKFIGHKDYGGEIPIGSFVHRPVIAWHDVYGDGFSREIKYGDLQPVNKEVAKTWAEVEQSAGVIKGLRTPRVLPIQQTYTHEEQTYCWDEPVMLSALSDTMLLSHGVVQTAKKSSYITCVDIQVRTEIDLMTYTVVFYLPADNSESPFSGSFPFVEMQVDLNNICTCIRESNPHYLSAGVYNSSFRLTESDPPWHIPIAPYKVLDSGAGSFVVSGNSKLPAFRKVYGRLEDLLSNTESPELYRPLSLYVPYSSSFGVHVLIAEIFDSDRVAEKIRNSVASMTGLSVKEWVVSQ